MKFSLNHSELLRESVKGYDNFKVLSTTENK